MKTCILIVSYIIFHLSITTGQCLLDFNDLDIFGGDKHYKKDINSVSITNNNTDLFFDLRVDNDMTYFTDRYFSSGISLKVYAPFMDKSPFNKVLLGHHKDVLNYYALTFTHNMYTPIYYDTLSNREEDHPFAAYLLLGSRKESFHKRRRYKVTSELQLGVIGPLAGGQVFQHFHY